MKQFFDYVYFDDLNLTLRKEYMMSEKSAPLALGSDHAGFELKEFIKSELVRRRVAFVETASPDIDPQDDYPLTSARVARAVANGSASQGISLCGTGIGASIAANRFLGVRAALCITPEMAAMARKHNDANVLVLGGRITTRETAAAILDAWFTEQPEGGRHQRRIEQMDNLETLNS